MTKKEALDFLELTESATDKEIEVRIADKLEYFQRLAENAPNDFLRKLHTGNIDKVKGLQSQLLNTGEVNTIQPPYTPAAAQKVSDLQNTGLNHRIAAHNKDAVAWLVRHTENQSAKTFPLYYGKNFIGRNPHTHYPTIIISEDPYVSRLHAMIEVTNINPLELIITDDPISNDGRQSKNGTYINGDEARITKKTKIRENDTIQVGMTKFNIKANTAPINKVVQEVEESDYMKTVVIDLF